MKARVKIPKITEKSIFQESSSACAFCRESEVSALEIHHIDEDPSHNADENLILVCGNCHGKITAGVISQADVVLQKRMAVFKALDQVKNKATVEVNVSGGSFRGDVAHTINKFASKPSSKIQHPVGSIGANLWLKGYIDYLLAQYYEFKKADESYGVKQRFSHAVIHKNIQKKFGYKTFFIPEEYFADLSRYIKSAIDRTIQGKTNRSRGIRNYHSFEEHPKTKPIN
jgi:hypothetical protein